ncbi:MAG: hypothetical protein ACXWGX_03170, partial [Usitatibacter sp.]
MKGVNGIRDTATIGTKLSALYLRSSALHLRSSALTALARATRGSKESHDQEIHRQAVRPPRPGDAQG